jgi:hypothetical protein
MSRETAAPPAIRIWGFYGINLSIELTGRADGADLGKLFAIFNMRLMWAEPVQGSFPTAAGYRDSL